MAVLPLASCAVTVTEKGVPAVVVAGIETFSLVAAPAMTVITPESVVVRMPLTACSVAPPMTRPVNTALVPVVAVDEPTRSPLTTPPLTPARLQEALTLATKLSEASRLIA